MPSSVGNGLIAFDSNRDGNSEIYSMNADGSNPIRLTNTAANEDLLPAWSPDGSKIAFTSNRDGNWEIYVMNADGSGQTRLTNNSPDEWYADWSPDGSKIAFATYRDGNQNIYVMNADGTNVTRLTNNPASDDAPAFSPDGSKIAFASNRDGTQDIYVMNADGSNQTRLTSSADVDFNAAWSPDGSKIAFQRGDGTNTKNDIYVMNADGSGQTNITNNTANNDQPAWSPDGSKIAFVTRRDGNSELYSMNADGSNQTRLTNNSAVDTEPAWQPVPLLSNQSPIAHAGGPYIINEGDSLTLDASGSSDPDGDSLSYSWDINGDGNFTDAIGVSPILTWSQLQALGIDDGPSTFSVAVQVDDGQGNVVTSPSTTLTLANTPPTVAILGAPVFGHSPEGTSIDLTSDVSDPSAADMAAGFTHAWCVTKNGNPFAWANAADFSFVPDDNGSYVVSLTATDKDGGTSPVNATTITVDNVPPTAGITGPSDGVRGQQRTFALAASDDSTIDESIGFAYVINWGDESLVENVAGSPGNGAGVQVDHVFTQASSYTVLVAAIDKDGGVSGVATQPITISVAELQDDPIYGGQALAVGGSLGNDRIVFTAGTNPGDVDVTFNGIAVGTYQPTNRVIAFGQAGDDDIRVTGGVSLPAWLYGGDGNDRLAGGSKNNVLLGGRGDDILIGGSGRDLLIGGIGTDQITGKAGDDLLIAGATAYDNDQVALAAVLAEWTSSRDYATRTVNLLGAGNGPRLNGTYFLRTDGPSPTVFDDGSLDILTGSAGQDWFFANIFSPGALDKITDLGKGEIATDI